jgi:hypothetical protein
VDRDQLMSDIRKVSFSFLQENTRQVLTRAMQGFKLNPVSRRQSDDRPATEPTRSAVPPQAAMMSALLRRVSERRQAVAPTNESEWD